MLFIHLLKELKTSNKEMIVLFNDAVNRHNYAAPTPVAARSSLRVLAFWD
jgi:hypothetical protein